MVCEITSPKRNRESAWLTILNRCEYINGHDLVVFILVLHASLHLIVHLVTRLEIAEH